MSAEIEYLPVVSGSTGHVDPGSTAFIIVCAALVNFMTPGLAFFYGGLVRQQNVLTIIMQNFVAMGLVTIIWVVWGFSLCFGKSGSYSATRPPTPCSPTSGMRWLHPASPSRASSPRPETPETKTPRARRAPKQHRSARALAARLLFETSRSPLPRREPRARPRRRSPQFSTISPAHAGHARGAGLCPPVSDSCFLASIRFFLFFQNIRRRRVAVPYADLPPNDDAPSPLRDTYAVFQGMFAVIAPALMTGAFADRMMFTPYLIFIAGWVHLVYFPWCHSVWGGRVPR